MKFKHLKNCRFNKFLKKEKITWSEILLLLALILLFFQMRYMIKVYNDPCNYCVIHYPNKESITCKEAFMPKHIDTNILNITISHDDIDLKNDR